jgi:hypothetical protein
MDMSKRTDKFICRLFNKINSILDMSLPGPDNLIFWSENRTGSIILSTKLKDKQTIFDTLVHEIIHALNCLFKEGGAAHGREFKMRGRVVLSQLKSNLRVLRQLFQRDLRIDGNNILRAKGDVGESRV